MTAKTQEQDALAELIKYAADGKLVDYLADSDAAEEIVCWVQEETGIKSKSLIRIFVKQAIKIIIAKGKLFAQSQATILGKSAYDFLKGIKSCQVIARGLLTVLEKIIKKQLDIRILDEILAGKRPARDVMQTTTLSKEFCAQYNKLLDVEDLTGEMRELMTQQQNPQPDLELPLFPVTQSTRMHFASRSIPFMGREQEFKALRDFLCDEREFCWWLVTGAGGLGKSRLALEFCLRYGNAWRMGFLPRDGREIDWRHWRPEEPTLMVVDYASLRSAQLNQIVGVLYGRTNPLQFPVRILLLERGISKHWWDSFMGDRGTHERYAVELSQYGEPLALTPLEKNNISELMLFISQKLADQSMENVLERLTQIDPQCRPLFAAIAADAIESGRDLRNWDTTQLLADLLGREQDRIWAAAGVTEADKNLLALATLGQGIPLEVVNNPPTAIELPKPGKDLQQRYEAITGKKLEETFQPLEPDIVGEFYVLELLNNDSVFESTAVSDYWQASYKISSPFVFIERCILDFPQHPVTTKLATQCFHSLNLERATEDWAIQVWFMRWMDLPPLAARAGQFELADNLLTEFGHWAENNVHVENPKYNTPYPIPIWYCGSLLLTVDAYVDQGKFNEALALAKCFVSFEERFGTNGETIRRFELVMINALLREKEDTTQDLSWVIERLDRLPLEELKVDIDRKEAAQAILRVFKGIKLSSTSRRRRWADKMRVVTSDYATNISEAHFRLKLLEQELHGSMCLKYEVSELMHFFEEIKSVTSGYAMEAQVMEGEANIIANQLCHYAQHYGPEATLLLWQRLNSLFPPCCESIRNPLLVIAANGVIRIIGNEDLETAVEIFSSLHAEENSQLAVAPKVRVHYADSARILAMVYNNRGEKSGRDAYLREIDRLVAKFDNEPHLAVLRDQMLVTLMQQRVNNEDISDAFNLYAATYSSVYVDTTPGREEKRYWQFHNAAYLTDLLFKTANLKEGMEVFEYLDTVQRGTNEDAIVKVFKKLQLSVIKSTQNLGKDEYTAKILQNWLGQTTFEDELEIQAKWLINGLQLFSKLSNKIPDEESLAKARALGPLVNNENVVSCARGLLKKDHIEEFDQVLEKVLAELRS
jgi:hypothetical protein